MRPKRRYWWMIALSLISGLIALGPWSAWIWRPRADRGRPERVEGRRAAPPFPFPFPLPPPSASSSETAALQPAVPPAVVPGPEAEEGPSGPLDMPPGAFEPGTGLTVSRDAAELKDLPGMNAAPVNEAPSAAGPARFDALVRQASTLAEIERNGLAASGPGALKARRKLVEALWLEGRFDEAGALAETAWREANAAGRADEALEMLRIHIVMGLVPLPIDQVRAALDRAAARAPDDDRIGLARANLAVRDGRLDEAGAWLETCRRRHPDDPAVWRARLAWARAAGRFDEAREALAHLHRGDVSPERVLEIRAWLARRRGDADAERQLLEESVRTDPGNLAALDRLAELAARAGRRAEIGPYRRRKAELDRALQQYRDGFREGERIDGPAEMARLAELLGRRFEAVGLRTLALVLDPDDTKSRAALERLSAPRPAEDPPPSRSTLAQLLATELVETATVAHPSRIVQRPAPRFDDDAAAVGLNFVFDSGASPRRQLPEVMSGGVGLLDYDGDGWLDVYVVQGGAFPPDPALPSTGDRLFRNRGDGTFEDMSVSSGIARLSRGYGHGVTVGDYDNDGRPDLFLTRWRAYVLFHNRGDGTFEDATERAGLGGDRDWPTSAAFADLDNDGDLDLYVCHYLDWDAERPDLCQGPNSGRAIPCGPRLYAARPDHVFRNDAGRFIDATREAGIVDADGRGLGVIAADFDADGRTDLFVANDGTANYLFRNRGGFRFEEMGELAGVAAASSGGYQAGMGVACGDFNGDGRPDLAVTNFFGESTTLYQNLGGGLFADRTSSTGLDAVSRHKLGFGVAFLDADADGRLDLLTANGHIADERPEIPYAMPAQLLLGGPGDRLTDVSTEAGPPFQAPRLGRGLAIGDLDADGRVDALVVGLDGPLAYFHNRGPAGHAISIALEGTRSNRDAIGAMVTIAAEGRRQTAWRFGGGSYQSAGGPRLHFGLGTADRADTVEVRWPSGQCDRYHDLAAGSAYLLREGSAQPRVLPAARSAARH